MLYRNNLKDREFGKEALQNFDAERATIAERQGASEHQNSEAKPTQPKTDSSGCFGIIRISSPKTEGILQVSKWLKFQVLLDAEEMHDLLSSLGQVQFVCVAEPVKAEDAILSSSLFEDKYAAYANCLKRGEVPVTSEYRRYFSSAMSADLDPFYALSVGPEKYLIKPIQPVIQLQGHSFFYSERDGKFHPMVLSEESVTWGLQFSYPQLFQDLKTRKINKVSDIPHFPNNALFSKLSKWMRNATLPTPFQVAGVRTNSPIRIGKKSLAWIKSHPQLKMKGITILGFQHEH